MTGRLLFILLLCSIGAQAQTRRIDSLRNRLSATPDEYRAALFNAISREFAYRCLHADSALHYTGLGYRAAAIHNDSVQIAAALIVSGDALGRLLGYPVEMTKSMRRAVHMLEHQPGHVLMPEALNKLAISYTHRGLYDSAYHAVEKAKSISLLHHDRLGLAWATAITGFMGSKTGEYWRSIGSLFEAREMGKELNDSTLTSFALAFIARCFNRVGDPQTALRYYREAFAYATPITKLWPHMEDVAYAHLQLRQYDSVLYSQQLYRQTLATLTTDSAVQKRFLSMRWGYSSEVQLARKQFGTMLDDVLPQLQPLRDRADLLPLMRALANVAKAYEGMRLYTRALQYARELNNLAASTGNREFTKEATQIMSSTYWMLGYPDSAYRYHRIYAAVKDSIQSERSMQRAELYVASLEAEKKIRELERDRALQHRQMIADKTEMRRKLEVSYLAIAALAIIFTVAALILRNVILKHRNEQLEHRRAQLELRQKATELEMQALRAQMNPHFIFNCLSAIDNLIQTHQPDKATTYLARFAKLIRGVLDSSKNNLVSFQKDFETLRLYLELECFRFNNKFEYRLHADQRLLNGDYKVPPLIIQPFLENAIHHGLLNKEDGCRKLEVSARLDDEQILYHVMDNGVGRKKAAALNARNGNTRPSYGIDITRNRIFLHNGGDGEGSVMILDLEDQGVASGTEAIIRITSA